MPERLLVKIFGTQRTIFEEILDKLIKFNIITKISNKHKHKQHKISDKGYYYKYNGVYPEDILLAENPENATNPKLRDFWEWMRNG